MHGNLRPPLGRLCPAERSLLLFLAVLLGQSAYTLFAPGGPDPALAEIDVIVRTASASIFGYFLSAGLAPRSAAPAELPSGSGRVAAATGIGLFCLLALLVLRNTGAAPSPTVSATVVQFRDFVSGSVGFLLGCPASGGTKKGNGAA